MSEQGQVGRIFMFALVGIANTAISYGSFLLLVWAGLSNYLSIIVSWASALMIGFFLTRRYVFPWRKERSGFHQIAGFFFVAIVGLMVNMAIFAVLREALKFSAAVSQAVCIFIIFFLRFYLNDRFVFGRRSFLGK